MEQQDWEFMKFKVMVQKTINVKAKTGLKSIIIVQDLDIYYSQSYYPFKNIVLKVQTQKITAKDCSCLKKSKANKIKSACVDMAKLLK